MSMEKEKQKIGRRNGTPSRWLLQFLTVCNSAPIDSFEMAAAVGISHVLDPASGRRIVHWGCLRPAEHPCLRASSNRRSRPRRPTGPWPRGRGARQGRTCFRCRSPFDILELPAAVSICRGLDPGRGLLNSRLGRLPKYEHPCLRASSNRRSRP